VCDERKVSDLSKGDKNVRSCTRLKQFFSVVSVLGVVVMCEAGGCISDSLVPYTHASDTQTSHSPRTNPNPGKSTSQGRENL